MGRREIIMEILFENRYTMTKELFFLWAKNPIKKNYFWIFWLVFMVITIIMAIYSALNEDIIFSAFYVLLAAFCIYRGYFRNRVLLAKHFKVLSVNQGSTEWVRIVQFADFIKVSDGNTITQYQWSQIMKVIENEKYYILLLQDGLGIRLDKNGFTKGTSDTFLQYIINNYQSITLVEKNEV